LLQQSIAYWELYLFVWLLDFVSSGCHNSGSEEKDVYSSKREEPVLALLLDKYFKLEIISIDISKLFSYPTLHFLLTTSITDYCLKRNVNDFDLRKPFLLQLRLKCKSKWKSLYWVNTRELNRVSSTKCLPYIHQLVGLCKTLSNLS